MTFPPSFVPDPVPTSPNARDAADVDEWDDQLKPAERPLRDLLESLSTATTEDAVFDLLASAEPPPNRLVKQKVRGRLVSVLAERFKAFTSKASAAKTADAWLSQPGSETDLQGRAFEPEETPPWESSVDGDDLLGDIVDVLEGYSYTTGENLVAAALWVLHTHLFDFFGVSPILQLSSPTKRCGKTSTLLPIRELASKGLMSSNITPAALFRAIEAWHPTLVIDEADTFMKMSDELKGLMNAGHTKGTAFTLRAEGDGHEPRVFSTWSPKAVAAIGRLPDTIEDRAIRLILSRKPTEVSKKDAFDEVVLRAVCEPIRRRIARWVLDYAESLGGAEPARPDGMNDRAWNNWRPLLAIAEVAGEGWPAKAARSAVSLSGGSDDQADLATLALEHIRLAFGGTDRISTHDLLVALVANEEGRWAVWWAADVEADRIKAPAARLAKILHGTFGIKSRQVRFEDGTRKGYLLEDFAQAFAAYLPKDETLDMNETQQVTSTSSVSFVPSVSSSEGSDVHGGLPAVALLKAELDATEIQANIRLAPDFGRTP